MSNEYFITCKYCNNTWKTKSYFKPKNIKCDQCGDKNCSFKEIENGNIFGYSEKELEQFEKELRNNNETDIMDLITNFD